MKTTMKRTVGVLLLSTLTIVSGCSKKTDSENTGSSTASSISSMPKRYELQSGIVYYEPMVIMGIKSVSTLYFDDYGRRESRETVTDSNIMGMKSHEKKVDITDGDYMISYELEKIVNGKDETSKVATKTDIKKFREMAMKMGKGLDPEQMKKDFDYREEGTEVVAGVTGIKYSVSINKEKKDQRAYGVLYKKIALKTEMGGIMIKAAKIEENATVPSSKFEVPAGYTIKEIDLEKEMNDPRKRGNE
jgi:hypothetical protein